mmetsp:Transcript_66666/g.168088  ORF Transcript_66666/g.168088 Transcript_66666/m.168088 type:complete len:460 (-) Transcript_66666:69-1448(-)
MVSAADIVEPLCKKAKVLPEVSATTTSDLVGNELPALTPWAEAFVQEGRPLADAAFAKLHELSFDGIGISRESYGRRETAAMEWCARWAKDEGLQIEYDRAANLIVSLPGQEVALPARLTGSHLDSVPKGGNFDGAAGVIAGLVCLVVLKRRGVVPPRTLKVYAFRGEESGWFAQACKGSASLFGLLKPAHLELKQSVTGETLRECMRNCGADVAAIERGERLLDTSTIASFTELHIEQCVVLDVARQPLAVVPSIRGLYRLNIDAFGKGDHAGATPRDLRRDAVAACAEFMTVMNDEWRRWEEEGKDLVWTCGICHTHADRHSYSTVPDSMHLGVEFRSRERETIDAWKAMLPGKLQDVGKRHGVDFKHEQVAFSSEAIMAPTLVTRARELCREKLGFEPMVVDSGAGHDAAHFAQQGVPTVMIFVRNQNGSHNPKEAMRMEDFMVGTALLAQVLLEP